jgi:polyisoprenoid-binding protein YceI
MNKLFTLIAIMLTLAGGLSAQTVWKADKAHSSVNFSVSHMVISEVTGNFKDFGATLTSSKDDFSDAVIDATIQMASVNTDNDKRDAHLKSDDFFNVEKFPTMTFKSTNIERTGPGTFKITGNLTMRDVTKPVVLDTKLIGQTKTPWGTTAAGFKATTVIDRLEFGTKWNQALETGGLIVGKDVTVTLLFEFDKQEQAQK